MLQLRYARLSQGGALEINRGHSVGEFITNAFVGTSMLELVSKAKLTLQSGAAQVGIPDGRALYGSSTTSGASCTANMPPTTEATIVWVGLLPTSGVTTDANLIDITYNSSNSSPYVTVGLKWGSGGSLYLTYSSGATNYKTQSTGSIVPAAGHHVLIGRVKSGSQKLYLDGNEIGGFTGGGGTTTFSTLASTATSLFEINDSLNARQTGAYCAAGYVVNKYISDKELADLSANPFVVYR